MHESDYRDPTTGQYVRTVRVQVSAPTFEAATEAARAIVDMADDAEKSLAESAESGDFAPGDYRVSAALQ